MEPLYLTTSDAVKIAANHFPVDRTKYPNPRGWIVFLHMMPATKESWSVVAARLQQEGYEGIAIDFRGHGSSDGGPDGYLRFSDQDHQNSAHDVAAAVDLFTGVGAHEGRIALIGASIGANLAIQYVVRHRMIKTCVAVSPGLDYHGILTKPSIAASPEDKRFLFIGSRDDDRAIDNVADIEALWNVVPPGVDAQKEIVAAGGHGTALLSHHPELIEHIILFLNHA